MYAATQQLLHHALFDLTFFRVFNPKIEVFYSDLEI
jgi:hypothetical protein